MTGNESVHLGSLGAQWPRDNNRIVVRLSSQQFLNAGGDHSIRFTSGALLFPADEPSVLSSERACVRMNLAEVPGVPNTVVT